MSQRIAAQLMPVSTSAVRTRSAGCTRKNLSAQNELEEVSPPIWRRIQVPGDATLGWLHAAIQLAMGWTNSHLHQFICCDRIFSDPVFEMNEFEDDPPVLDEHKVRLRDVVPHPRSLFTYQYDFGDSWEHIVKVEMICDRKPPRGNTAKCLDGARACPPEDCGGAAGYGDLLETLADPEHEKYEDIRAWLGAHFNPEAFQISETNKYLRKLSWPHTTLDALAGIMMQRFGSPEL